MDALRFDAVTRFLAGPTVHRRTFALIALEALGIGSVRSGALAGPGCKNVGKKCTKAKDCCSGVCKGKKGKKRCKPHDTGGCQGGLGLDLCPSDTTDTCVTAAGLDGHCRTTTGNAAYCGAGGACISCRKDADCRIYCGSDAACVRCEGCDNPEHTACMGGYACNFAP